MDNRIAMRLNEVFSFTANKSEPKKHKEADIHDDCIATDVIGLTVKLLVYGVRLREMVSVGGRIGEVGTGRVHRGRNLGF